MRMVPRTNPSDALERLSWVLNYHVGETLSINEVASQTDLSWATTKKYARLLEVLGRIAPQLSVNGEGITVDEVGDHLHTIQEDRDVQLVMYLLIQAEIEGGPKTPLSIEEHFGILSQYDETVEELDELGWLERDNETIALKPEGISIAGQARSAIRNKEANRDTESIGRVASSEVRDGQLIIHEDDDFSQASGRPNADFPTDDFRPETGRVLVDR